MNAACLVLLALPFSMEDVAGEWPCWRGPRGDGISRETGWSDQGTEAWRAEVGIGYSGLSVSRGRLFTAGFDEAVGVDRVFCLSADTGEEIWKIEYPAEILANFHGGGTLTTPTVDGDLVFVSTRDGQTRCLQADDGKVLWHRNYAEELEVKAPFHGMAGSPLVLEGALILSLGGVTAAVDRTTGDVFWKTEDLGEGSYSMPVVFQWGERPCLIVFCGPGLAVIDRASGEQLFLHPFKSTRGGLNAATPVVIGPRVFFSSAYDMGCVLLDFALAEPAVVWASKRMRNKVLGSVLLGDHLYGFDESILKCMDLNGREKWRKRGLGLGAVAASDGRLLVLSSRGDLLIVEATPEEYRERSKVQVLQGGVYWTPPTLANGRIYARNSLGQITARDHREDARVIADAAIEASLPSARDLFARHVAAIGGEQALRRHTSMHLEGSFDTLSAGGTASTMTLDLKAPNKKLLTYQFPEFGEARECFDGEMGWKTHPFEFNGLMEGVELKEWRTSSWFHAEIDHDKLYVSAETVGVRPFGDRRCYAVEVKTRGGARRTLYFEVETGLMAGRDGRDESMIVLSDYRDFDGLKLPVRRTHMQRDTGEERNLVVQKVEFGVVEDATFAPVEKIRWSLMKPEEITAINDRVREKHGELLGKFGGGGGFLEAMTLEVSVHQGRLAVVMQGGEPLRLDPPDERGVWAFSGMAGLAVTFHRDEAGKVVGLTMTMQDGSQEKLSRLPSG